MPRLSILAKVERRAVPIIARSGIESMRYGLALIYIWFGLAKIYAPGDGLALVTELIALVGAPAITGTILAASEVLIGLLFLRLAWARYAAVLASFHLIGTFLPLVLLPGLTFSQFPFWLTLDGQFVIKNIVLHGAVLVIWAVEIRDRETHTRTYARA